MPMIWTAGNLAFLVCVGAAIVALVASEILEARRPRARSRARPEAPAAARIFSVPELADRPPAGGGAAADRDGLTAALPGATLPPWRRQRSSSPSSS